MNAARCKRYRDGLDKEAYLKKDRERKRKAREALKKDKRAYELTKFRDRERKRKKNYPCSTHSAPDVNSLASSAVQNSSPQGPFPILDSAPVLSTPASPSTPSSLATGPTTTPSTTVNAPSTTPCTSAGATSSTPSTPVNSPSTKPSTSSIASSYISSTPARAHLVTSPSTPSGASPEQLTSPLPQENPFGTKQAFYRSFNKTKNTLPKNPNQKVFVLANMVKDLSPTKKNLLLRSLNRKPSHPGGRPVLLDEGKQEFVRAYLESPGISYTMSGRKDNVYLGKNQNGEKMFKTKYYLMWHIRDLMSMLNMEDHPDAIAKSFKAKYGSEISFSTLHRFIKNERHIYYQKDIPEVSCLCQKCENLELLVEGVKSFLPPFCEGDSPIPCTAKDILLLFSCDIGSQACAYGDCINCSIQTAVDLSQLNAAEEVHFFQWEVRQGKRYPEKCQQVCRGDEAACQLLEQVGKMKIHFYLKLKQYHAYQSVKDNLKENEILVHVDFSENYDNKQQHAIQSAYFGYQSFSIYTVCAYVRENNQTVCHSYALINETTDHNAASVFRLNSFLIALLKEKFSFDTIHFFSDGCAAQFRSKHVFLYLAQYDPSIKLFWHYFESSHGKGPVDGVGGTVKGAVYRKVMSKQVVLDGPKHFAEFAQSILKGIEVVFVSNTHMSQSPTDPIQVPGTLQVRFIERTVNPDKSVTLKFSTVSPDGSEATSFREVTYMKAYTADGPIHDTNPTSRGVNDDESPCIDVTVGKWYAAYYEECRYWFVGMAVSVDALSVSLDFLEQVDMGKNAFTIETSQSLPKSNIFYQLKEIPKPLSSSRASVLTLSHADFKQIESEFKIRYLK